MLFCTVAAVLVIPNASCPATVELTPAVDTTTWPDAPFRWKDIASNLYAQSYRDTYAYDDAEVTITFEPSQDSAFAGHLSAVGLKPNFAYQMKIVGKPEGLWGEDGDDVTNEHIGYAGRWWRATPNPGNSNDQDYEAHRDDPEYIYEGYLLFDFFVTDRFGTVDVDFATESSYHVLWWEGQRAREPCDSPVRYNTVVGQASDPAYDTDIGPVDIGVYAEIERLCYGQTVLDQGDYNCRFFLTEESFHQSGEGDGYWLSVLVCDTLFFDLRGVAGMVSEGSGGIPALGRVYPNPFRTRTSVAFSLGRASEVDLAVFDATGRLVARLVGGETRAGDHLASWDGRDSFGGRVPAGVYFCRLRAEERSVARKMVLID